MSGFKTTHYPMAAQALAGALTSARRGRGMPTRDQRAGKLDRRRLSRVGVGDLRIFQRRLDPAPQRIRCTILVDASASMGGGYDSTAAQVCRNLADATEILPWVTADVVGFTTGGDGVVVFPVWETGEPTKNIDAYMRIPMSGTEEGYAIAFAFDELKEKLAPSEQGLIIIVSDGGPSEPAHVKSVVRMCWDEGIPVVSVALNSSAQQPLMYGHDNVIYYDNGGWGQGNDRKLARDMARAMGRVL
jgi:nitric oxide reductase activation protein